MKPSTVGHVSVQIRGVSYDKSVVRTQPSRGYLPLLRGGNIGNHGLIWDDLQYVPESIVSAAQVLRAGDVVLAASSGSLSAVGKAASFDNALPATFGAFCKALRPNERVDPGYFAHYFKTTSYRRQVSALAEGANINNLRKEHLDNLTFPVPPLDEQRRIAAILDKADQLRAKRREALAHLDTLTHSIFHSMFGSGVPGQSAFPIVRMGEVLASASYGTSERADVVGSVPVLRMGNLTYSGQLDLSDLKYLPEEQPEKYMVRDGDVLFNRTNSPDLVGKTATFRGSQAMAFAGYLVRLRTSSKIHPEYLTMFMNLPSTKQLLRKMCKSIVGMANINAKEVQTVRLPLPPLELQQTFATRVAAVERLKEMHRRHLAELDALFSSLQHRAFKGEL